MRELLTEIYKSKLRHEILKSQETGTLTLGAIFELRKFCKESIKILFKDNINLEEDSEDFEDLFSHAMESCYKYFNTYDDYKHEKKCDLYFFTLISYSLLKK
jgi:hypothetical protein